MENLSSIIGSGILEMYVLGQTTPEETAQVEQWTTIYPEISRELNSIGDALANYAKVHSRKPSSTVKPFLMATLDYMRRLEKGETPGNPPHLNEHSEISGYAEWLEREDLQFESEDSMYAHIIGKTEAATTAIVWLTIGSPDEVHTTEFEKFLIIEGSCDLKIGDAVHQLNPGDYLTIPLHTVHSVKVTSLLPCKFILQRIAA